MDRGSRRPLIAVVEDNEDNCVLLHALLDEQYDLRVFSDGPSALASIPCEVPELLLLDVSLPGMDGVELLGRLRALPDLAHLPAVALTAHAMEGDRERLLAAGFQEYVQKPILDEDELRATLELLLADGRGEVAP